jgi:hypothetical protein
MTECFQQLNQGKEFSKGSYRPGLQGYKEQEGYFKFCRGKKFHSDNYVPICHFKGNLEDDIRLLRQKTCFVKYTLRSLNHTLANREYDRNLVKEGSADIRRYLRFIAVKRQTTE